MEAGNVGNDISFCFDFVVLERPFRAENYIFGCGAGGWNSMRDRRGRVLSRGRRQYQPVHGWNV